VSQVREVVRDREGQREVERGRVRQREAERGKERQNEAKRGERGSFKRLFFVVLICAQLVGVDL
jgi:hypothetical protein